MTISGWLPFSTRARDSRYLIREVADRFERKTGCRLKPLGQVDRCGRGVHHALDGSFSSSPGASAGNSMGGYLLPRKISVTFGAGKTCTTVVAWDDPKRSHRSAVSSRRDLALFKARRLLPFRVAEPQKPTRAQPEVLRSGRDGHRGLSGKDVRKGSAERCEC